MRVPLSGRKVRGWVVELGAGPDRNLREIVTKVGATPVFDLALFRTVQWASHHYVAPMSVVLGKVTPPNLPKARASRTPAKVSGSDRPHPFDEIVQPSAKGRKQPTTAAVGPWQSLGWLPSLAPILSAEGSILVVAATAAEVEAISSAAEQHFPGRTVPAAGDDGATLTRAWETAQLGGRLVIGTPRVAMWQIASLRLAIVLEEGRRAMKERQTPTLSVRELLRTRSKTEGFNLVFFGPTPSLELLAAGAHMVKTQQRAWALVEIIDRNQFVESSLLAPPVVAALRVAATTPGETAFVATGTPMVQRVVDEINRALGGAASGPAPGNTPILVGTERDLAGLAPVSLTVAVDIDFMAEGINYRASEEVLRQLARLGNVLRGGRGRRLMVQTKHPNSMLCQALRRGDPIPYLEQVLVERVRQGFPPSVDLVAVEIRDSVPDDADQLLRALPGIEVLGPMPVEQGVRWLLSGDLRKPRQELRGLAAKWRESGAAVRIDADPIDL